MQALIDCIGIMAELQLRNFFIFSKWVYENTFPVSEFFEFIKGIQSFKNLGGFTKHTMIRVPNISEERFRRLNWTDQIFNCWKVRFFILTSFFIFIKVCKRLSRSRYPSVHWSETGSIKNDIFYCLHKSFCLNILTNIEWAYIIISWYRTLNYGRGV